MRIFLAGASGVVGRRLLPLLLGGGHQVTGATRSTEKAALLRSAGATPAIVDVFDAAALRAAAMEQQALGAHRLESIVLRYGLFYGPGTWFEAPGRKPGVHVDAAAHAAFLAVDRGAAGLYNIADDDGVVISDKARQHLGFDP